MAADDGAILFTMLEVRLLTASAHLTELTRGCHQKDTRLTLVNLAHMSSASLTRPARSIYLAHL